MRLIKLDKEFEERMDKLFRSDEQNNTIKLSTQNNGMVEDNKKTVKPEVESIYKKQFGLKTSIGIMGSVIVLVGVAAFYLMTEVVNK